MCMIVINQMHVIDMLMDFNSYSTNTIDSKEIMTISRRHFQTAVSFTNVLGTESLIPSSNHVGNFTLNYVIIMIKLIIARDKAKNMNSEIPIKFYQILENEFFFWLLR